MQQQRHEPWWRKVSSLLQVTFSRWTATAIRRIFQRLLAQFRRVPRWVWQFIWFIVTLTLNYLPQIVSLLQLIFHGKG